MSQLNPKNIKNIYTQTYSLVFNATTVTTANITVSFRVGRIITKQLAYMPSALVADPSFVTLRSSLISNQSHGVIQTDPDAGTAPLEMVCQFLNPLEINGSHTFTLSTPDGLSVALPAPAGLTYVLLTLQFEEI